MSDAVCLIYLKNAKNAIVNGYAICHLTYMSFMNMAIRVSNDASGPQECRPMPLNNLLMGKMAYKFRILTSNILPNSAPSWILSYAENLASSSLQDEATEWHYYPDKPPTRKTDL